jgi:catechol 2,3-dioxygenase-like lactoylglutathione lyase family enzyme
VVVEPGRSDACSYEADTVLVDAMVVPTVAVTDLDQAKRFFGEQVGLKLLEETPFALRFEAGKGTQLSIRKGQPNVGQTVAHFEVADIDTIVRDLTSRGVEFQEYETPKTIKFIAQVGPARGAWFADADGNVFGVREGPVPGKGASAPVRWRSAPQQVWAGQCKAASVRFGHCRLVRPRVRRSLISRPPVGPAATATKVLRCPKDTIPKTRSDRSPTTTATSRWLRCR